MSGRSGWGWGHVDRALPDDECVSLASMLPGVPDRSRPVPEHADVVLPEPRRGPPDTPRVARPALRAVKSVLDPAGILNPGVLTDDQREEHR